MIAFRKPPVALFESVSGCTPCTNVLTIALQPDEGFALSFEVKTPGEPFRLQTETMRFVYPATIGAASGYETLLLDHRRRRPDVIRPRARGGGVVAAFCAVAGRPPPAAQISSGIVGTGRRRPAVVLIGGVAAPKAFGDATKVGNRAGYTSPMRWRVYFDLIKEAGKAWVAHGAASMGAALAFYSAFSIAPLLIIVMAVVGAVYGADVAQGEVERQLKDTMGPTAAAAIQTLLTGANGKSTGFVASIVGIVTLLVGATSVLVELQKGLDTIWDAPARKGRGIMRILRSRATSLGLILGIGFLLLVSLVVTGMLAVFSKNWGSTYPGVATALYLGNFLVSLSVITALIAMLFKWLPNVPIAWREVWIGALTTALLFIAGQTAIGFYLTRSALGSAYGAAGAMVVLLTWLYYSAQIFLFGAEFTQVYARRCETLGADCLKRDAAADGIRMQRRKTTEASIES